MKGGRFKLYNAQSISSNFYSSEFKAFEIDYQKLRDNFLAQGNKRSADDVMYELALRKDSLNAGFLWNIYGTLFGYGYQPWRFLIGVIIIALLGAFWYYRKYYPIVAVISNEKNSEIGIKSVYRSYGDVKVATKKSRIMRDQIYDHSNISRHIGILHRIWHVVFFSFSVLLGIRWKKEWSEISYKLDGLYGSKTFLRFVTFEYILGIALYITFAILVKGSQFEYIKGLLGF